MIEKLVKGEACFWLEKVKGIRAPKPADYNLDTNTETLLQRDFDLQDDRPPYTYGGCLPLASKAIWVFML